MKNQTTTIRKIVKQLNIDFWLPNIQRNFVWKEEQIERLFDSLMRDYPIGTLLVWKAKINISHRKFIDNYKNDIRFIDFYVPDNEDNKLLVLDGQQRLQSLFIGLCGSYNGKELYFNVLSGQSAPPEDIRYIFKFSKENPEGKWIKLKDLVFNDENNYKQQQKVIHSIGKNLEDKYKERIAENVSIIEQVFKSEDRIVYQELDSIDQPKIYGEDDVVEIFIRANSGGTPLGKSDLLFSLLLSSWQDAEEKMENLLEELNKEGYAFNRDFILKTCLTLLDKGASYKVEKFRDIKVREEIENQWKNIENSIKIVKDFLYGQTYLRSKKALRSYLALIPIIYFHYHCKDKWQNMKHLDTYILKTLLAGSFGGSPDGLIDNCIKEIKDKKEFNNAKMFNVIQNSGRSLKISRDELLRQNYGKRNDLHLIFNLWYKEISGFNPSYSGNELQIDHIFPDALLKEIKINGSMKYKKEDRDQIGNLMLLTRDENGAGGKGDSSPVEWFKNKDPDYLKKHLIPDKPNLWEIEKFGDFLKERKQLITGKFRDQFGLLIKEERNR